MNVKYMDKDSQMLADQFENFVLSIKLISGNFRYINKEYGNFINRKYILQLTDSKDFIVSKYVKLELNEDRGKFETATLNFGFPRKKIDMKTRSTFKKEIISIFKKYDITSYSNDFLGSNFSCNIYRDTNIQDLVDEVFSK